MYKRLLVAVDNHRPSLHALQQAFQIAPDGLLVVSVAPPYEGDLRMVGVKHIDRLLRGPCDKAIQQAQQLARQAGVAIRTACVFGEPHSTIVETAQEQGCDLIVLGKHGPDLLELALANSVTGRVIGHSPIDVRVIPEGAVVRWGRILLTTDGSGSSRKATARAMELAKNREAELSVVSVLDLNPEFYAEAPELAERLALEARQCVLEVEQQAQAMGIRPQCTVRQGDAFKAILKAREELDAAMIVMGSHGRQGLKRWLMGSVTEQVINHAPCPVLVAK
jgi:nucleotide-binding universal stress UspA family protein